MEMGAPVGRAKRHIYICMIPFSFIREEFLIRVLNQHRVERIVFVIV